MKSPVETTRATMRNGFILQCKGYKLIEQPLSFNFLSQKEKEKKYT